MQHAPTDWEVVGDGGVALSVGDELFDCGCIGVEKATDAGACAGGAGAVGAGRFAGEVGCHDPVFCVVDWIERIGCWIRRMPRCPLALDRGWMLIVWIETKTITM